MTDIIASTYEILQKIGAGGGGEVYLAYHTRLNKKVVLKADKREISTPKELLRREVDVLKTLRHAHIPQVYDFFVEDDTVYTVMDYIEGESLDRALKRGETFSQPQVIEWAIQLLDALAYLHAPVHGDPPRGFIHSDIKPANIMRLPDNTICLIDFNIALALGEENVIGASAGYSSPEHYGIDYSTDGTTSLVKGMPQAPAGTGQTTVFSPGDEVTVTAGADELPRPTAAQTATGARLRTVVPDIRSDIYSTGATLYHLLSGQRPNRNAKEVVPLSPEEFSPPLAEIINRAMQPNPDLRFQTADEMLAAFVHLRDNDPRVRRLKRQRRVAAGFFAALLCVGTGTAFLGLQRIRTAESWLKLAEYSENAWQEGDTAAALDYARQAFPSQSLLTPAYMAPAQKALAQALGVYDLSDTFQPQGVAALPSSPLSIELAPDGATAACMVSQRLLLLDTQTGKTLAELPASPSALAEVEYIGPNQIVYAGEEGLCAYDVAQSVPLWQAAPATAVAVSADGKRVAAINGDAAEAIIYDTATGAQLNAVDFGGRRQSVVFNDIFANPNDNLLALNADGSRLAVSFADGSLWLYDLNNGESRDLLADTPGYTHFEGGFCGQYFAFSATGATDSIFVAWDTAAEQQTGGYQSDYPFHVLAGEYGVFVQTENILVQLDPANGEQQPLVTTAKSITAFAVDATSGTPAHTLISTEDSFIFYDANAAQTAAYDKLDGTDFVQITGGMALVANRDVPAVRILRLEDHSDATIFAYDPAYVHDEARLSADEQHVMLFSYNGFRIYALDGNLICETEIPNAAQVYDQQFRREGEKAYLEVIYYDGTIDRYDAATGVLAGTEKGMPPDPDLYEEFTTDTLRIESPLHGTPSAYDRRTGRLVAKLSEDAYLTYVTQVGDNIVAQYVTADGFEYGELLDPSCKVLAELPYLSDVVGEDLIYDYPTGTMRKTRILHIDELIQMAKTQQIENQTEERIDG